MSEVKMRVLRISGVVHQHYGPAGPQDQAAAPVSAISSRTPQEGHYDEAAQSLDSWRNLLDQWRRLRLDSGQRQPSDPLILSTLPKK